jgi:hypothetical protein
LESGEFPQVAEPLLFVKAGAVDPIMPFDPTARLRHNGARRLPEFRPFDESLT